ncbi:related to ThiJ/PfpI family protein [Cephalotrichum gorgonifer]|uniref:Related to ThiJ/PfpI family protein n=1 Tax=Cephalotrichum gorgonifer TaxID=2041049 RepID=A0AAE8N2P2_9PEZI|nr:related to ThiJ/PfpI family protein [Cephalotrichum gorgonifer]
MKAYLSGVLLMLLPLWSLSGLAGADIPPPTEEQERNQNDPLSFGLVIFDGFEPLDVWGPLEVLYRMSWFFNISLSVISHSTGPISTRPPAFRSAPDAPIQDFGHIIGPAMEATHTFQNAPSLDVIMVPGGGGLDYLLSIKDSTNQDFFNLRYEEAKYVLSVCTGAFVLASAGLLDGRRATTSKFAWNEVVASRPEVDWVPSARWVEDGNIWTSSGVSAGIDMMYAFMKHYYGEKEINIVMNTIEFAPHTDSHWDPFAVVHEVPGADPSGGTEDCFGPVEMDRQLGVTRLGL